MTETAGTNYEARSPAEVFDADFAEFIKLQDYAADYAQVGEPGDVLIGVARAHPSYWLNALYRVLVIKGYSLQGVAVQSYNPAKDSPELTLEIRSSHDQDELAEILWNVGRTAQGRLMYFMSEGLIVSPDIDLDLPSDLYGRQMRERAFLTSRLFWRYIHGTEYPQALDEYAKLRSTGTKPFKPIEVRQIMRKALSEQPLLLPGQLPGKVLSISGYTPRQTSPKSKVPVAPNNPTPEAKPAAEHALELYTISDETFAMCACGWTSAGAYANAAGAEASFTEHMEEEAGHRKAPTKNPGSPAAKPATQAQGARQVSKDSTAQTLEKWMRAPFQNP